MMDVGKILADIINSCEPFNLKTALDQILPPRGSSPYSLGEIDEKFDQYQTEIEALQHFSNNKFDAVLDHQVQSRVRNLSDNIKRTQTDVDDLKREITRVRQHLEQVKIVCNDESIEEREEMLLLEQKLKLDLQRSKFTPILDFFKRFCAHLESSIATCKRLSASNSANYLQIFDWANYHQEIFLLRACGQAIYDLEKLESLYQRSKDVFGLAFRQPINKIDLNNFIEFHNSYSLETQVDVILNSLGDRCELGVYLRDPKFAQLMNSPDLQGAKDCLFSLYMTEITNSTIQCCRLLIDINIEYIEAHLTDGINIDKLNGYDPSNPLNITQEKLPSYAFSPQDYITQIGQHLLALKKQTEKFDQIDSKPLLKALKFLNHDAGNFNTATEVILKCIARHILRSLVGRTTASVLSQLNDNGLKQIATDAIYLNDILSDLNLIDSSDPNVERFKSLCKTSD